MPQRRPRTTRAATQRPADCDPIRVTRIPQPVSDDYECLVNAVVVLFWVGKWVLMGVKKSDTKRLIVIIMIIIVGATSGLMDDIIMGLAASAIYCEFGEMNTANQSEDTLLATDLRLLTYGLQ